MTNKTELNALIKLYFWFAVTCKATIGMLPIMYSAEPMTTFLLVVMQEVAIECPIDNNTDSVLEATQAVLAI